MRGESGPRGVKLEIEKLLGKSKVHLMIPLQWIDSALAITRLRVSD